jgi:DNA-directed RNA polymerase subunit E'/Rpb7
MEVKKATLLCMVPVQFIWLNEVKKGLHEVLDEKLNKWDFRLSGIIKSFAKIRILEKHARILEDAGTVLVKVKYTVNYYKPQIGQKIEGAVKNWTATEIGILVEGFNAVIKNCENKFENGIWRENSNTELKKDSKVSFTLTRIDFEGDMVLLIGSSPSFLP